MRPMQLIGAGLFAGVGLGQLFAWWIIRRECPDAPGLIALSTFGVGEIIFGSLLIFIRLRNFRSS